MMSLFDLYDAEGNVIPFEERKFDAEDMKIMQSGTGIDYTREPIFKEPTLQKSIFQVPIQPKDNLSKSEQSVQVSQVNEDVSQSKPEIPVRNINVDLSGVQENIHSEVFDHNI